MEQSGSTPIRIHFTGSNNENLSLGEYVAVRKDLYGLTEELIERAAIVHKRLTEIQTPGEHPILVQLAEQNKMLGNLIQSYLAAQSSPAAVIKPIESAGQG